MIHSLLQGLVELPDTALILADWLEDQDDPRAELVRLTWQLQYEEEHPDFNIRQARVQALLMSGMVPVRPRMILGPDIELAWIPPGSFWMGSPDDEEGRYDDELLHRVTLTRGFWMGVTPVTQGQWQAVMGNKPNWYSRTGDGKNLVAGISDEDLLCFPMEGVSWEDAQTFCAKLSEGLSGRIKLPTEAEWEYACRAGTRTTFNFGSTADITSAVVSKHHPRDVHRYEDKSDRQIPTKVGSYVPNAWGLFDCHGQVMEYCEDSYVANYYATSPVVDPICVELDTRKVGRGGAFCFQPQICRSADRFSMNYVDDTSGFRICFRPE